MQRLNRPQVKLRDVVFVCVVLLVIIADQLSKIWIRASLDVGQAFSDVGFFRVLHVQNTGAAFGIFQGHSQTLLIVISIGVVVLIAFVFLLRSRWASFDSMRLRVAIGLVVGGMIGNLIDRGRQGYVTDFLDFRVWPVFNIADASAVFGAIIIAFCIITLAQPAKRRE